MDMLVGIVGGLLVAGLTTAGILGNIWILIVVTVVGAGAAAAGSWYEKVQAEIKENQTYANYPPYGY